MSQSTGYSRNSLTLILSASIGWKLGIQSFHFPTSDRIFECYSMSALYFCHIEHWKLITLWLPLAFKTKEEHQCTAKLNFKHLPIEAVQYSCIHIQLSWVPARLENFCFDIFGGMKYNPKRGGLLFEVVIKKDYFKISCKLEQNIFNEWINPLNSITLEIAPQSLINLWHPH